MTTTVLPNISIAPAQDVRSSKRKAVRLSPLPLQLEAYPPPSVRRTEINPRSPSTEPSDPDADLKARFHDQLSNLYRTETEAEPSTAEPHADDAVIPINNAPDASNDAYEFRLFSAPSAKPSAPHPPPSLPQRIILRSPTPPTSDPGFLTPRRPSQYYFTGRPPPPKLAQYRLAAITGEEILAGLNIPWVRPLNKTPPHN